MSVKKVTKTELIERIAKEVDCSKAQSAKFLGTFIDVVYHALKKREVVEIMGFVKLSVEQRKAREGRNPKTGEAVKIPATEVVKVKVGKALKEVAAKK